ncbi:DUF1513 domain-containing protein [Hyphomicrobium sp.]|uniref:DUF1513 domain-containing protein n=1 Tax=Hyphomicrobium sp. TaxID=82 RepID=UPI000FA723B0|nr:DUF1513 domain-containing protein [Hyphomicrobium sp.]RUO99767.1 MAG: DUF1513 domain-containing protein [Hyphomicrobium sp.]
MSLMAIDRRHLLLGTLAFVGATSLRSTVSLGAGSDVAYVTAARLANGSYGILLLNSGGKILREVPLSARGHDIAINPRSGRVVVFARRPGAFAVAFEMNRESAPQVFTPGEGRHYFGHGTFSRDGRLLYASENDIATGMGVIGIYDVGRNFKKIGEHSTFGMGPHEIMLLADGKTIAAGNGGLDTTPEAGRENLNTETMQPSLAFVGAESGNLIAKHEMSGALQSLSLRHVTQDAHGVVWFGGQWEGSPSETPPQIVGSVGIDRRLKLIEPFAKGGDDLKGYIGAMAASNDGRFIAASAPKAGHVVYVDTQTSKVVGISDLKDVCGLAPEGETDFAASSGFGIIRYETARASVISEQALQDIAFDNHLRRVS